MWFYASYLLFLKNIHPQPGLPVLIPVPNKHPKTYYSELTYRDLHLLVCMTEMKFGRSKEHFYRKNKVKGCFFTETRISLLAESPLG